MSRRFRIALAFLTRLPGGADPVDEAELADSLAAFPLVGALLGAIAAAVLAGFSSFLEDEVAAVLTLAVVSAATGALHLDGLADTFDALGAGRDPERRLGVMRDSRIGAHGAVALVLVLLAQAACLAELADEGAAAALVGGLAVARALAVLAIVAHPYARARGLGRPFVHSSPGTVATSLGIGLVVALLAPAPGGIATTVVAVLAASTAALAFWWWLARSLGGLTGDTYGAGIEIAQVAYLCAVAAAC